MNKIIRIEKRLPFGFTGDWGKLYKKYIYDVPAEAGKDYISVQNTVYKELGQDVQFRYIDKDINKSTRSAQPVGNVLTSGEYCFAETTDAYFDADTGTYECVVGIEDVVRVFGKWWIVEKIDEKSIFSPAKHSFYFLGLKRINPKFVKEKTHV